MTKYCSDCYETTTSDGRQVELCPKHAMVDSMLVVLKMVAELPTFHGICTCRYCQAFNAAKAIIKEVED